MLGEGLCIYLCVGFFFYTRALLSGSSATRREIAWRQKYNFALYCLLLSGKDSTTLLLCPELSTSLQLEHLPCCFIHCKAVLRDAGGFTASKVPWMLAVPHKPVLTAGPCEESPRWKRGCQFSAALFSLHCLPVSAVFVLWQMTAIFLQGEVTANWKFESYQALVLDFEAPSGGTSKHCRSCALYYSL